MKFFTEDSIEKIREGFFSAVYFIRTQQILLSQKNFKQVTMQIFQKQDATLCGIEEVLELLKECAGYYDEHDTWVSGWDKLSIQTLKDGEKIGPWETVMHITGPYVYFAHLESIYLGILARRTRVASNVKKVLEAANGKQVLFFADRFDYFLNQEGDGYAAAVAGISSVCTPAHSFLSGVNAIGTIPHALIAVHDGNTLQAAESFSIKYPQTPLIVLVDFENDCVKTALEVARVFGDKLYGVRLDTSEKLIDKSLQSGQPIVQNEGEGFSQNNQELIIKNPEDSSGMPQNNNTTLYGVNPTLVKKVREALDAEGFTKVKIIVSGGFTAEKISAFEQGHIPVDMYGVGSSLLKGSFDFTADIVKVEDKGIAKVGRNFKPNERLQVIDKQ